jgi:protein SCO1/2
MSNLESHPSTKAMKLFAIILTALLYLFSASLLAQAQMAQQQPPCKEHGSSLQPQGQHKSAIPDIEVLDQSGKPLRFYSDLMKGKTVIVNFIFTSCTYICPLQGAIFSRLQATLGDRLGKDVTLISISTDPLTDTPQRLKLWGERFHAKSGWTLVTGKKTEMDRLLVALTGDPSGLRDHSAIALMGNYDKGVWIRADALDDPMRLIKSLDNALLR